MSLDRDCLALQVAHRVDAGIPLRTARHSLSVMYFSTYTIDILMPCAKPTTIGEVLLPAIAASTCGPPPAAHGREVRLHVAAKRLGEGAERLAERLWIRRAEMAQHGGHLLRT